MEGLNASGNLPFEVVLTPTLISQASIRQTFNDANNDPDCAGVITWMHTFSPAKMWILGLKEFRKPFCHLHTQFNEELPYDTIDMDFMNDKNVAVTEDDKVEAQIKFGWEIDHYCVNDLVEYVDAVLQGEVNALVDEYYSKYKIIDEGRDLDELRWNEAAF